MAQTLAVVKRITGADSGKQRTSEAFLTYGGAIRGFIRKRVDNFDDAEDILQNVFHNLAKIDDEGAEPIESISSWLYRVATNQIIDFRRKKKEERMPVVASMEDGEVSMKDLTVFLMEEGGDPQTAMVRSAVWVELEEALAELPAEQRTVFELTELQGFSFKEISQSTGIPVNTLLSRKRYAVLHLRERLAQIYEDITNDDGWH